MGFLFIQCNQEAVTNTVSLCSTFLKPQRRVHFNLEDHRNGIKYANREINSSNCTVCHLIYFTIFISISLYFLENQLEQVNYRRRILEILCRYIVVMYFSVIRDDVKNKISKESSMKQLVPMLPQHVPILV